MKVVTAEQMQQIDSQCASIGLPTEVLMENAGKAVATEIKRIFGTVKERRFVVLVGPGNNGGDGLVSARYLNDWGASVTLYLCTKRPQNDRNLELVRERSITTVEADHDEGLSRLDELLLSADAVIDAIFGTGNLRPFKGILSEVLDRVSQARERNQKLRLIALDLPSGLDATTSAIDPACPYADYTITLGFPKIGLFNMPGAERVGKLSVVDIGIPEYLAEDVRIEVITPQWVKTVLPKRPLVANKGSFGRILIVAGSINYIGAAYLACSGAMRVGAGLVALATPSSIIPILASRLTETTYLPLPENESGIVSPEAARLIHNQLQSYDVLLIGCGLGQSDSTSRFLQATLFESEQPLPPLVLDADGLNILAKIPEWWRKLSSDAIITPHPGEMSRLTGVSIEGVQTDRIGIAMKMANEWHKTIVLKGAYTVVAGPGGQAMVSLVANPGLASAGTGDVLAGAIAGLLGQGLSLFNAAACGVYLHGMAGEMASSELGNAGMLASDLLPMLPRVIKNIKES